jgi:hypothetical protein
MLVSHKYPHGIWTWVPHDGKETGGPLDQWNCVGMQRDCRLSAGLPPAANFVSCEARRRTCNGAWNRDRRAVWDQVGLSHCQYNGLVMVRDEAHLRRRHNDQSRWGHQCSEATLTGEFLFHISTPLGLNPGPSWWEASGWTTGTVELCRNAVRLQALHNKFVLSFCIFIWTTLHK